MKQLTPPRRRRAAVLTVALSALIVFFWAAGGRDARYALRVLVRQDSGISDAGWKRRLVVEPASSPLPWSGGGRCAGVDALPTDGAQSLVVVRDGRISCEWYGDGGARDRPAAAFSVSKTVLSLLVSRAVAEGAVASLDEPVTDRIPELLARDRRFAAITLRDLLDMRSGIAFSDEVTFPWVDQDYPRVYYATDLESTIVRRPRIEAPPGGFRYNDYAPNLVGLAVRRETGEDPVGPALQRLWDAVGAEYPAGWSLDDQGFPYHESGFVVTARDLARIGQLMLDGGRRDGRQVAPAVFVERSLAGPDRAEAVTTFAGVRVGYRNGWWLIPRGDGGHDLAAMGAHGQVMLVSPVTRTVAVRMGDDSALTNIEIAVALQRAADRR